LGVYPVAIDHPAVHGIGGTCVYSEGMMDQDQGAGIDGEYAFQIGGSGQYIPFVAVEFTAVDGQVAGGFQIGLAVHRCRGGVDIQLAVQVQHAVHGQVERAQIQFVARNYGQSSSNSNVMG